MEFGVNPTEKMVRFCVDDKVEEVTFKFALQLATKVIEALTNGSQEKMKEIMAMEK